MKRAAVWTAAVLGMTACQLLAGIDDRTVFDGGAPVDDAPLPDVGPLPDASEASTGCPAGQDKCDGKTCIDITADTKNCGYCGHDCRGGVCDGGMCPTIMLAGPFSGNLLSIAVDQNNVYFSSFTEVRSVPKTGGPAVVVVAATVIQGIDVVGSDLYYTRFRTLYRTKVDGGTPQIVNGQVWEAGSPVYTNVDVDLPHVYISTQSGLYLVSEDGGGYQTLLPEDAGYKPTAGLAHDGANLFASEITTQQLFRIPSSTGTPASFNKSNVAVTAGIAVTSDAVYWTDAWSVRKVPLDGGPATILDTDLDVPTSVQVDDRIYIGNQGTVPSKGSIQSRAKDKPGFVTMAKGDPAMIAIDADYVYWVNYTARTVMKVAR